MRSVVYKSTNDFLRFLSERVEEKIKDSKNFLYNTKERSITLKNNINSNISANINPNLKIIE
ncbi:MAG: hypothetical protein AABZ74_17730 [Cyanobacteriota bacterium]